MVMKAPVWFAIAHIDLTAGSSGYHRAELIESVRQTFFRLVADGTKTRVPGATICGTRRTST